MTVFFDLFSPGNRHRADERERLEHTREVESPSEPGRGPIDLSSGVVLIKPTAAAPEGATAEGSAAEEEGAAEPSEPGTE